MLDISAFLKNHQIDYQYFDHPAVFTCEEAARLCPDMPGVPIKNLFLRDKDGKRHFLVVVRHDKNVDLKELKGLLGVSKLSFASADRLQNYLGLTPGAVTLLGLVNDKNNDVEIIFDQELAEQSLQCHPLVNTATLVISSEGIMEFLGATNHTYKFIDIPRR